MPTAKRPSAWQRTDLGTQARTEAEDVAGPLKRATAAKTPHEVLIIFLDLIVEARPDAFELGGLMRHIGFVGLVVALDDIAVLRPDAGILELGFARFPLGRLLALPSLRPNTEAQGLGESL